MGKQDAESGPEWQRSIEECLAAEGKAAKQ
ncbi:hypothetical protein HDF09_003684 [Edaphobacter lichenicola]|uniref:Uncharacterized protein n=1 Tax=Tunturiibacter empetritectus TaxID=3069691 RepID=A0A7W8MTL1_9BACT|nr:hypothetical protein [Edaphobacter lichenicola]